MSVFIEIDNIFKTYKTKTGYFDALKGVSFSIFKGEIFSLLGANGAGKTTLSSILASLHPATQGDIKFDNKSIYQNLIDYRMILGYCPQYVNLDSYFSVWQNLIFAGRYYLMDKATIQKRARELIGQFGLENYVNSKIETLSGGYKQRVLIARALMHRPKFLILDEPTVGLDPHIRRELWQQILDLKEQNVTVLLTTHYLDEAEKLSDRVCILDKGKILLIDTPNNLKSVYQKGNLEDVFIQLVSEAEKDEIIK